MGALIFLVIILGIGKALNTVNNSTGPRRSHDQKFPWD